MRTIHGSGRLRSQQNPRNEFEVQYYFQISDEMISRPGFAPAAGRSHTVVGRVESTDSDVPPPGVYDLLTESHGTIRVQNVGFNNWQILAPDGG